MTDKEEPDLKTKHTVIIPGVPEVGRAVEKATDALIVKNAEGLRVFLGQVCGPVAEQFGEAWADQVKQYRYLNHLKFLAKAQAKHKELGVNPRHTVKPRLMLEVLEASSLEDNEDMQDWWAGLSISSIEEVPSDSNLIFINIMKQITSTQKKIIEFMCTNAEILHTANNLIIAKKISCSHEDVVAMTGVDDINKLDREIDSLRSLGLLEGGYDLHGEEITVNITPEALCLHFYASCNGKSNNPIEYLGAEYTDKCPSCGKKH